MEKLVVKEIPISNINDSNVPMRRVDKEHVSRLLEVEDLDKLPPILIDLDNSLVGGQHTLEAFKLAGRNTIKARVIPIGGDKWVNLIASIKDNLQHGLPLTRAEKADLAEFMRQQGRKITEIAAIFEVTDRAVKKWLESKSTPELTEQENEIELEKLIERWLKLTIQVWGNFWGNEAENGYFAELLELGIRKQLKKSEDIHFNLETVFVESLRVIEVL